MVPFIIKFKDIAHNKSFFGHGPQVALSIPK